MTTSVEFNSWANNYIKEFKRADKNYRKIMIGYIQKEIDGYQLVLNQLKDMEDSI